MQLVLELVRVPGLVLVPVLARVPVLAQARELVPGLVPVLEPGLVPALELALRTRKQPSLRLITIPACLAILSFSRIYLLLKYLESTVRNFLKAITPFIAF